MRRLALAVVLAGCCPTVIDLPGRYRPLQTLEDDASDPGVYHAFGSILRGSTCDFAARSQKEQEALLLHEQFIARHQLAYPGGVAAYNERCRVDARFLSYEELSGWELQLTYLVQAGAPVDKLAVAKFLSDHYDPPTTPDVAVYFVETTIDRAAGK